MEDSRKGMRDMAEERMEMYLRRLYQVRDELERKLQEKASEKAAEKLTGTDFENMVYEGLLAAGFAKDSITHSAQKFPDFILEDKEENVRLGVEVKKTDSARWEVIGGSIYESLKNDIEATYVLMAKMGGEQPEVRLKRYEDCIADLKVTHSPRFYLNLELEEGEDYLTRNDAEDLLYLSGEDLNRKIRRLLRTQKSTWWSEGETTAFSELSGEEKGMYLNDGIALFPEVFGGDYRNFTPWLVYSCLIWCGNVRDIFSAGGNQYVEEDGIYVSAVMYRALQNLNSIGQRILDMTQEEQVKFWGKSAENDAERIHIWLGLTQQKLKLSSELVHNNGKLKRYEGCAKAQIEVSVKNIFMDRLKSGLLKEEDLC